MLNDLWFCCLHAHRLKSVLNRPPIIAYCPIDGILTRPELYSALGTLDQIVAYAQFGNDQLSRITHQGKPLASYCFTQSIEVIAHGVDCDVFFPMQPDDFLDRSEAKRRLFGNEAAEAGFVVFNAAKHDARKRLDLTIEGFARFARNKPPDVKLYLHTGATFDGPDIRGLAERSGITGRLISTDGWLEDHPAVDDSLLNLMYNATDVGINTSSGEGWGLVSFEHAATGAPQIVPAHTACEELWTDVETTLPVRHEAEHFGLAMIRSFVDPDDIALVLERLYADKSFRHEQAHRAYETARRESYRWDQIAKQWDRLFQQILERSR
jgi:D-inositol-3-phosphate glycosyltransferase